MKSGRIKFYNEERGFGFLEPNDGGVDVFFHVSVLRDIKSAERGLSVEYDLKTDQRTGRVLAAFVMPIAE